MPKIPALPPNTEGPASDDLIVIENTSNSTTEKMPLSALMPTGSIMVYAGSSAPAGYLLCDGDAVSRTTYASLFAVIGENYGAGDGSTTFNLPNLKGRVPVGLDTGDSDFNTLGKDGGSKNVDISHVHSKGPSPTTNGNATGTRVLAQGVNTEGMSENSNPSVLQPFVVLNYIIKS